MRRNRPEQQLQIAVMEYLDQCLPHDAIAIHVPNGGRRSPAEAGIFKAMGVKAGVFDILVFHRGMAYGIELKAGTQKLTSAQIEMAVRFADAGVPSEIARSVTDVERFLDRMGITLRGRIAA